MRKLLLCLIAIELSLTPAFAQKFEVFGGYQFTHQNPAYNGNGFNVSFTGNFEDEHVLGMTLGITGDLSWVSHSECFIFCPNTRFDSYTVGPVLTARRSLVQPFVRVLFGVGTASMGRYTLFGTTHPAWSHTGFVTYLGGGMDLKPWKRIGFRVFQIDWLGTTVSDVTTNGNVRASAGMVLRF